MRWVQVLPSQYRWPLGAHGSGYQPAAMADTVATRGWERVFQERVPGARGQAHVTLAGAGHFLQEDAGPELGRVVADVIATT